MSGNEKTPLTEETDRIVTEDTGSQPGILVFDPAGEDDDFWTLKEYIRMRKEAEGLEPGEYSVNGLFHADDYVIYGWF